MMNIKLSKMPFWIILLCLFCSFFVSQVSSNQSITLKIGDKIIYDVLDSSDSSNYFFGAWPPGDYLGNWSVCQNERISFELANVTSNEIKGVLDLGNYSFSDVRNIDAASALILSIYPWNGGFFANVTDWDGIMVLVENTNTTITLLEGLEYLINNETQLFDTYHFKTENYYGQYSSFYYDINSGILLSANSSFTNYYLSISLSSTNFDLQNTAITSHSFMIYVPLLIVMAIIMHKRK